ncbi:hypothetical protein GCM10012286_70750 [Streptomyces lasiicapitis]|uniref:Translation initiation factor IF-2 n=1 Tax=Streptomyces lasiicapitis TaxID=1923961 RepID=A0ABQ2MQX5_9ACTN|nr:hypothetical protein GCM10012286_70750 [Streptomyces lasiicapitis]
MSFEGHKLNDMIDLVEHANPADLESAGEAIRKARDAIAVAARELGDHIDRVDWEGEAGQAFRKWGKKLVKETHQLSDFADTASVQITSAGAGLASVRSAMPPRDTRTDPKAVEDIPSPKRVDGNADFEAALKSEKHRQEAINQMNRLASFYKVSQHEMAGQEPPTFSAMPDVGVPLPRPENWKDPGDDSRQVVPPGTVTGDGPSTPQRAAEPVTPVPSGADGPVPPGSDVRGPNALPDRPAGPEPVGTEIDSVAPPPPQTVGPGPASPPSVPGPTGIDGGPPPLPGRGPLRLPSGGPDTRAPHRGGGGKLPLPADQGRAGTGGPKESVGRPGRSPSGPGPVGRTGPVAQGKGISAPVSPVQPPVGRGITGGTPQPRGLPGPRPAVPGITGTPRADGVVGGRPAPGSVGGPVGNGQRGVMGAAPQVTGGRGQMPRRPIGNPDGVVGTPKERGSTGGSRRNGFTAGGTGLVRGPAGDGRRSERDEDEATQRPDYLVEDEETHLPGERRHVPPVIG